MEKYLVPSHGPIWNVNVQICQKRREKKYISSEFKGLPWQQTPIWSTDEYIYGRLSSYLYQFLLWTRTLNWFVSFSQLNPEKKMQ